MSPVVLISAAFVSGAALGSFFPAPWWTAPLAAALGIGACLAAARAGSLLPLASIATSLALGWVAPPPPKAPLGELPPCERAIEGTVRTDPLLLDGRARLEIDLDACSRCLDSPEISGWENAFGRLYLTVLRDSTDLPGAGAGVRIRGRMTPLSSHANLGRRATRPRPGSFTMLVEGGDGISVVEPASPGLVGLMSGPRRRLADFWRETLDERGASLARALVLGESRAIDRGDREVFRRTGTAHLLAVSGLHLGLVVALVFGVLKRASLSVRAIAERTDPARIAAAITIPLVIAFAALVGGRAPVVRAATMAIAILIGICLGRKGAALESVSIAAAALVARDPSSLTSAGFQLSFAAVLGFLVAARIGRKDEGPPETAPPRRRISKIGSILSGWLRGSLAASAATTPFLLYHFDRFSLVAVPVNAVAVPVFTLLLMPALLAATLLGAISPSIGGVVARPLGWALELIVDKLALLSRLPITVDSPDPFAAAGILLASVASFALLGRRLRTFAGLACAAGALCALSLITSLDRFEDGALTVDFLDVGQGDSTLVTFPDGRHWLVDGGGTAASRMGADHLLPALRSLGVRELDTIVLTHPDPDHVAGLPAVLAAMPPKRLWENTQGSEEGAHESYFALLEEARARAISIESPPRICGRRDVAGVTAEVFHPCHLEGAYDPTLDFNENSIAMRLSFRGRAVLLTGDLGREGERIALERGVELRADLLKLGHHGSRTSSTPPFLDAVSPYMAVASCGRWNGYGMPHRTILERLGGRGIRLLRTDLDGGIRIVLGEQETRLVRARPGG